MYRPKGANDMTTPIRLLKPIYKTVSGQSKKAYPPIEKGEIIYCNWSSYGGTESVTNGVLTVIDTAQVLTWFRDDIKSDCRIVLLSDNSVYEILGKPENIEQKNFYCQFKVKSVGGNP